MSNSNIMKVKSVPFMDTELMAALDEDGQIWAAVRWMCRGIGLDKNQLDNQIEKVKSDTVLSKGAGNFPLPTNGGTQNVLCLELDYVPLWLAKISVTPAMVAEKPDVADRLVQFQLKAKDVLAAAFLPEYTKAVSTQGVSTNVSNDFLNRFDDFAAQPSKISAVQDEQSARLAKVENYTSYSNYYLRQQMRSGYDAKWERKQSQRLKVISEFLGRDQKTVLHEIYREMEESYGIRLSAFVDDYKRVKNVSTCSTLSVVSFSIALRQMFDTIIEKILKVCNIIEEPIEPTLSRFFVEPVSQGDNDAQSEES